MTVPTNLIALPTASAHATSVGTNSGMPQKNTRSLRHGGDPAISVTPLHVLPAPGTQHHRVSGRSAREPEIAVLPLPRPSYYRQVGCTAECAPSAGQRHHIWARRQQRTIIAAALAVGAVMGASLYYSGADETTSATEITVQPAAPK